MSHGHVFVSYAKEDRDSAQALVTRLREDGFVTWIDRDNLLPGQDWDHEIRNAIRESSAFLVLLSDHSVSKTGYLQKEIREAVENAERMPEGRVFIIPVRLDECSVPARLSRWHWLDLFTHGSYERLKRSLSQIAGVTPRRGRSIQRQRAYFQTALEHLAYEICASSFEIQLCRISPTAFALTNGHILVFGGKYLEMIFNSLRQQVPSSSVMPPRKLKAVVPADSSWKANAHRAFEIDLLDTENSVTLRNVDTKCHINPSYWRLATALAPRMNRVFLTGDNSPVYIENEEDRLVMVVMPLKVD